MSRNILLRFGANDELILLVDKVAEKLKNTNAGITKVALYEFCNKILNQEDERKIKSSTKSL